jgi:HD-like signal output (HDOD) protein/CheY-like chemotaxis protein
MQLCQKENVPLSELAHTIQADPVLAGRIVKIANVANPNKSRPIASVTIDTLILIGIHAVRQVVLGFSLVSAYRDGECEGFDYSRYWSRSVAMASAAQAIGAILRIAPPAELFTCGLLADIGKLGIAAARPVAYSELISQLEQNSPRNLKAAETSRFGMSHSELTAEMMHDWGFPKLFIDAVFHHENPEASGFIEGSRQRKLTYILQLAAWLAEAYLATAEVRVAMMPRIFQLGSTLNLNAEQIVDIANQTVTEWHDWGRLLNIKIDDIPPFVIESQQSVEVNAVTMDAQVSPMHILFADDDETLIFMVSKFLGAAGHVVFTANNGRQAYDIANREKPQVIVADWVMPETDGLTLCRAIRETAWGKKIYFIILTTLEDDQHQIEAFEAGADAYMKKPFDPRLLNAKLLAAQRRTQGS